MFWDVRKEEEVFLNRVNLKREEPEKTKAVKQEVIEEPQEIDDTTEKLNKITEQINLMSRYLTYLSEKFDKTIDSAITYDRNLDNIESRIDQLKDKIENFDFVDSSVNLERSSRKAV